MLRTRRRARDAISPFRRLASIAMSRRASGRGWAEHRKAHRPFSIALLPLLGYARRDPTLLACIWRLANCSGFVFIAISGIPRTFTQCLADATLLQCQIAKRSRRSRVATPAVLHGMVFLVRISSSSAFSQGHAGSSIAKWRALAVLRVRENRQLQSSIVYHNSG